MKDPAPSLRAIVLAAIVACIVVSLTGAKAGVQDKQGLRIAYFDKARLANGYKFTGNSDRELTKKGEDIRLMLQTWVQNYLLTEGDQKLLGELLIEEKNLGDKLPGDKKNQIKKLQDMSKSFLDEFSKLQAKPSGQLTPQEQERLQILVRAYSDTQSRVSQKEKTEGEGYQKLLNENGIKLVNDMRSGVEKIAKEKGYNVVFSSEVVWYADNDITDAVVTYLNNKK